jgi:hypothetical protein
MGGSTVRGVRSVPGPGFLPRSSSSFRIASAVSAGWPNYGIQYGMNGNACLFSAYGCFNHGLRRWINDWGTPTGCYQW